jgi:receptor protein-tyrosine kinase
VLAKHVGQVVLVVEAERTSRTAIDEALALLGPGRVGGVVLNKAPHVIGHEGFGQGYYGYYGT